MAPDDEVREGELLRRVTSRAIRRLDVLEYLIFAVAAVLAAGAGALVAFLLAAGTELPFRPIWIVASVFFFVVPAALAAWTSRRRETGRGESPGAHQSDSERKGTRG